MSKAPVYARNLMATWVGHFANLAVMFFLSPFIVHHLGNSAYGAWSLLQGLTGYLGLAEIGVRVSTGRYICYYLGRNEPEKVHVVVNTSLAFHTALSILIFGASAVVGFHFGQIFPKVPYGLAVEAKWVLLLLGLNIWLGLFSSTFRQLLQVADRFDLDNFATLVVLVLRTVGTLWVLALGRGLVALAWVSVGTGIIGCIILLVMVQWKGVAARYGLRLVQWGMLKELLSFGLWAFVGNLGVRIISYTDAAVIGMFLGVEQITMYSIGFMIVDAAKELVSYMGRVIAPDMLKIGGGGDLSGLMWLVVKGSRFVTLISMPLFLGLAMFGGEFIALWQGPGYSSAGIITSIISVGILCTVGTFHLCNVLIALGEVKMLTVFSSLEAAANLGLSIALLATTHLGIVAVALGFFIPMMLVTGVLQPIYVCRRTKFPVASYVRLAVVRWVIGAFIFLIPCLLAYAFFPCKTWISFGLKVLALGILYLPIGYWVLLGPTERRQLLGLLRIGSLLRAPQPVRATPSEGAGEAVSAAATTGEEE